MSEEVSPSDHPHAVHLSRKLSKSIDGALPVRLFLLGMPPLTGAVMKTETPGLFQLIAVGVAFEDSNLSPGQMPPPIVTTFTADQVCAIMWPDEELSRSEEKSTIIC